MCHVYHALISFKALSKAIISKENEFLPNWQLFKMNWQGSNYISFFYTIQLHEQGQRTGYKYTVQVSLSLLFFF